MSDVSIYKAHLTAARTAMAAADWGTALAEILQAEAALATLPDTEVSGDRVEWGRQLTSLKADVRGQQGAAGGIQRTKITKVVVSD